MEIIRLKAKKINSMFLRHFSENDAGEWLFIFIFLKYVFENDVSE